MGRTLSGGIMKDNPWWDKKDVEAIGKMHYKQVMVDWEERMKKQGRKDNITTLLAFLCGVLLLSSPYLYKKYNEYHDIEYRNLHTFYVQETKECVYGTTLLTENDLLYCPVRATNHLGDMVFVDYNHSVMVGHPLIQTCKFEKGKNTGQCYYTDGR